MKKARKKLGQNLDQNPIERFFDSTFGVNYGEKQRKDQTGGELLEGQEVDFKELARGKEEIARIEPAINYAEETVRVAERALNRENKELESQLREIMAEIKKLTDSSKELQAQFKEVAVEQHTVKPGKYHKSFFSWLLSVIHIARKKVEDSNAWLSAMHSKKKAKGYWQMADTKVGGTKFSLSSERVVATQVG